MDILTNGVIQLKNSLVHCVYL